MINKGGGGGGKKKGEKNEKKDITKNYLDLLLFYPV
jgi:hypothetical protein